MAVSLNRVTLIGNLGKDPEMRTFEGGGLLVKFPVATSETYTNKAGERITNTEWHNIVIMRKGLAEVADKYLKKGDRIFLEGRIKTRQWEDEGQRKYMTEIHGDNMIMLSGRKDSDSFGDRSAESDKQSGGYENASQPSSGQNSPGSAETQPGTGGGQSEEDDLPF